MVYPVALVGLSLMLIGVMTVYVLPNFTDFFYSLNVELPLITKVTMAFSLFVKRHIVIILLVLIGGGLAFSQYARSESGRLALHRTILRVPFVGALFHRLALSEFCRSLATLLSGGIPLVSSMEVAVKAVGNLYLRGRLAPTISSVREGKALAGTLEATGSAPEILVDMVEVGEATGSLDVMLSDVSDFLDEEIETRLQRVLSLLEPVMLVLMGAIVSTLLISVYLPLFSLLGSVDS
jgi:type IV pilus assembly protein PilC